MASPFFIEGPALVSVSGGRTSGYMLRRILDEGLQPDVHVLFADTGKERAETYGFVRAMAERWQVHIEWVQRPGGFDQLIAERKFLPNPVARFCTSDLKVKPMHDWMLARGHEGYLNVVGIRADEPSRVATMRSKSTEQRINVVPLAEAGVTREEVMAFWQTQPFDLQLHPWESNCDLCFLKGRAIRARIMEEHPRLAAWWIEKERQVGGTFRPDSVSYAALFRQTQTQGRLFESTPTTDAQPADDDLGDCVCRD